MIATPHWAMRSYMHEFRLDDDHPNSRRDARLPMLLALMLHANGRMRCWPSTALLCKETGFTKPALVEARKWLIKKKAITLVEHDKRVGAEIKLPSRQFIYQLTGVIETSKGMQPYAATSPELEAEAIEEVNSESVKGSESLLSNDDNEPKGSESKSSHSKLSHSLPKAFTISKDITRTEDEPESSSSIITETPPAPITAPPPADDDDFFTRSLASFNLFPDVKPKLLALPRLDAIALMLEARHQARNGEGSGLLASMLRTDTGRTEAALRLAPLALELETLDWPALLAEETRRDWVTLNRVAADLAAEDDPPEPGEMQTAPESDDPEPERSEDQARHLWSVVRGQLRFQLNRSTYDAWLSRLEPQDYAGGVLRLRAPNAVTRDHVAKAYGDTMENAGRRLTGLDDLKVEVIA